ncbi:hypothetical protein PUN28_012800 [Cardiocondyla obscurior]
MAADWKEAAINEMQTMTSKANISRYIANVIIGLHSAAVIVYVIDVLVFRTSNYNVDGIETSVREFTLKLQLPFECNESPLYEVIMLLEFLHQLVASATNGVLNCLIITLILHISGQIEILCNALRDISLGKNNQEELILSIKALISKHQKIIVFSGSIEQIFCYIALIQVFSGLIKSLIFYMVVTIEAFIFCFCGEYLSAKSKMIGDAAYNSIWYDFKLNECKLVLFIILRSQRRLTITAGKMMDLSLEGFTSIMKASLSYVSILHAMY